MEPEVGQKSGTNRNALWGLILIGLGIIFMFDRFFPGFVGGLLWAGAFATGGAVIYAYTRSDSRRQWALIPAYVMEVIAGIILLDSVRFIPGEFIGGFIMYAIGLPFLYIYMRDRRHWWALIPAYTMGAIGTLILLTMLLNGNLIAAYVMFAIALPFFYVYIKNRQQWWALIPGGIMGAIGLAFFVAGIAFIIPVLLIAAGVYLLIRHSDQLPGARKAPAPPVETPKYGPAADRPIEGFEPLRTSVPDAEIERGK
jgi:hypothetical protein